MTTTPLRCGHATEAPPLVLHDPRRPGADGRLWYCAECPEPALLRKAPPAPARRVS
jgi:hypothetical protein